MSATDHALAQLRRRANRLGAAAHRTTSTPTTPTSCPCTGPEARLLRKALYREHRVHSTVVNCSRCGTITGEIWGQGQLIRERRVSVDPGELRTHLAQRNAPKGPHTYNRRFHVSGCGCSDGCRTDRTRQTVDGKHAR